MTNFRVATFTKWKQSDGTHYAYNIRNIEAENEQAAIKQYKAKTDTTNKVGILA